MQTCDSLPCIETTENIFAMQFHTKKWTLWHVKWAMFEWTQPASLRLHTEIVQYCAVDAKYKNETCTSVVQLLPKIE